MNTNRSPEAMSQPPARPALPVTGYLHENFGHCSGEPAVIVNPKAPASSIAAWCWGEIMSLLASAEAMTLGTEPVTTGDIAAVFLHRLRPMDGVLSQLTAEVRAYEERLAGKSKQLESP